MIGIICAIQAEIEALLAILTNPEVKRIGATTYYEGKIANANVVAVHCRVGKVHASMATQALIDAYNPQWIINIGLAGGVGEAVRPFDMVVATATTQHDMDLTGFGEKLGAVMEDGEVFNFCNQQGIKLFCDVAKVKGLACHQGVIVTGDQFIANYAKRHWMVEQFDAMACEMEGAAVMLVAHYHQIPCNVIRMISDCADATALTSFEEIKHASINQIKDLLPEVILQYQKGIKDVK